MVRRTISRGRRVARAAAAGAAFSLLTGCASVPFEAARENFHRGRLDRAESALAENEPAPDDRDRVLFLMERGTIRQAEGRYADSSADWIAAADRIRQLETYSVSKGAASLVVNDSVQPFRGAPYERALLHAMTAINHFAVANWDNAAVEARRIVDSVDPAVQEGFPSDAFTYYVAGSALELIDDPSNAALLYRKAAAAAPTGVRIDDATGRIALLPPGVTNAPAAFPPRPPGWTGDLICFVMLGRAPDGATDYAPAWSAYGATHAEIRIGGTTAGRSVPLADIAWLAAQTDRRVAALKLAKTAARVAIKEVIAESAAQSAGNDAVGDLVRMLLIGLLEHPDLRRWGTLPRSLQVARVPCPPNLRDFEVVLRASTGAELRSIVIAAPLARRRTTWVSFYRDLPAAPSTAPQ